MQSSQTMRPSSRLYMVSIGRYSPQISQYYISVSENSCAISVDVECEFAAGVVGATVESAVGTVALVVVLYVVHQLTPIYNLTFGGIDPYICLCREGYY